MPCCCDNALLLNVALLAGSHESYVRAILAPACAPPEQGGLGYRAVVVNFRGCKSRPFPVYPASRDWRWS